MGRRHKPSHWAVNWTVVGIAAAVTLAIGIVVAMLTSDDDRRGGIVVPTPTTQQPNLIGPGNGPQPAIGGLASTPGRPATPPPGGAASILPGR